MFFLDEKDGGESVSGGSWEHTERGNARADWETVLAGKDCWQIETIQSGEPDGYGTYRWSYDETSYLPVADAMEAVQDKGYGKSCVADFLPDAICFFVRLPLRRRAAMC